MSTQKTLFDIFQPSTTKPSQTSSTGQRRKSDEDPQEISGPKKQVFSSKWLEEFAWLNSNRENTLTEVCEMLAKPGANEDILLSFEILAQVLLTIQLLLYLVKGDFQHKTESMELNKK